MKKVAAGENHTMALSRTGQVFSWGSNSFGQLGHPGKSSSSQSRLTPKRVDAFRFHEVVDIAASGCHSAAIDINDGAVYTWGSNRRGQLGRKEGYGTDQADATPRPVDALRLRHALCVVYGDYDSVRAEKLALSDWHTCVVLRCSHNGRSLGQVWQFGYGSYRPSRVNFPSDTSTSKAGALLCDTWVPMCKQRGMDIVDVSCAQNHSIALTASGSVFTWGHNVPALSHHPSDSSNDRQTFPAGSSGSPSPSPSAPQEVSLSSYGPVASVCASQDHCAIVTQQGDLVTWGCGQQGVLGHGRGNTWQPSPKRVAGVKKAVAVAAGHQHTAVLVAPVHPDFDAVDGVAAQDTVPSLVELAERKIAAHVDVANCMLVWQYAERYAAFRLQKYCLGYMRNNWDAVLDVVGRDRMETLFEIMLPPLNEPEPEEKAPVMAMVEPPAKAARGKKTSKALPAAKSTSGNASAPFTRKEELAAGGDELVAASQQSRTNASKSSGRRKNSKFVPLTSFLSNKTAVVPARATSSSPWGTRVASTSAEEEKPLAAPSRPLPHASPVLSASPTAAHAFPDAFPLPVASLRKDSLDGAAPRQRKSSIGSHPSASPRLSFSPLPKHMLGYDGVEHEQVTAFSLDAFMKQPARRGSRGKSAAPTWSSPLDGSVTASEQKLPPKTLKQIQEEEETAAAREREAKARLGGGVAPAQRSTVNSWGLFRRPDHVSLADVQRLQEEQEFLEQQRQILAEIEREQAAKARAAAAPTVGEDRNKRPSKAKGKKAPTGNKRGQKAATGGGASTAASAAGTIIGAAGDSQSKQQKQKKAKERKAARKAAGETFNAGTAVVASTATQPARGKKKSGGPPKPAAQAAEASHAKQSCPRQRKGKKAGAANAAAA
jgi:alpha-tubulin suppressor-like RCC1 family protein